MQLEATSLAPGDVLELMYTESDDCSSIVETKHERTGQSWRIMIVLHHDEDRTWKSVNYPHAETFHATCILSLLATHLVSMVMHRSCQVSSATNLK